MVMTILRIKNKNVDTYLEQDSGKHLSPSVPSRDRDGLSNRTSMVSHVYQNVHWNKYYKIKLLNSVFSI
jgi:hypothetical protein